jgi:hypothetical protein
MTIIIFMVSVFVLLLTSVQFVVTELKAVLARWLDAGVIARDF